jgi:hypothetical protein
MTKVTCQHSGIEFEASSTRTKQHPLIATLKAEANKRGNYREVNEALDAVKKAGGYTTIESYMQMVKEYINGKAQKAKDLAQRHAQDDAKRKSQQQAETELLKANGYEMKKVVEVENDDRQGEYDLVDRWYLFSPDGRQVSRFQALDEIKRGAAVVLAEIATAKAETEAKAKSEAEEKKAKIATHNAALQDLDAEIKRVENENVQVIRPDVKIDWETVKSLPYNAEGSYRRHDCIERGTVSGVIVYRIVTGTGYDDDGYPSYWCANPTSAGLTEIKPSDDDDPLGINDTFRKFF